MKAIVYEQYGGPEVLHLAAVDKPIPKAGEVLIRVAAASINSWDWDLLRGQPALARLGGWLKPQYRILGADVAGRVEAVGEAVKNFQPGDDVFGDLCNAGWGGFAEYVCADEKALLIKPAAISFTQAAALPQAGVLAMQGLRDKIQLQAGQQVLINGGGGGVGTFAIQMARAMGAEVTAVDHTSKLELMRSLGAAGVIDYTQENFTRRGRRYDLILDVVAHHSILAYRRCLHAGGAYAMIGGTTGAIFQAMLIGSVLSITGNKRSELLLHKPNKHLADITAMVEAGQVRPVIDRTYALEAVPEAMQYFGTGQVKGKLVIEL